MSIEPTRARCAVGHRRGFLVASAALGAALLLPIAAIAAAQVKVLQGGVRVNGKKASKASVIRAGDTVETAKGSRLVFVVGEDAFLLRGESKLMLEQTPGGKTPVITGLRLLSGALLAVFAPGARRIETPAATAGIRGTGVYIEASKEQTYFCTCYGVVELHDKAGVEKKVVISGYHTPNMIFANPAEHGRMTETEVKGHTDEELIMLERMVGRVSPIVQRNQKLKEASQPEGVEQPKPMPEEKPAQEQSVAPKKETPAAESKPAPDKGKSSEPVPEGSAAPKKQESQPAAPEGTPAPPQKSSKKSRGQKQKPKPKQEAPTTEVPGPEKTPATETPELGPAPTPPQQPQQPPEPEYRLPPPRLDN